MALLIFRFPLRIVPSELSETVYNRDKMSALFQSFQADAHLVLIFLKSVETVELSTRYVGQSCTMTFICNMTWASTYQTTQVWASNWRYKESTKSVLHLQHSSYRHCIIFCRTKDQTEPMLNFRVRISPDCVQQVRSHRRAFLAAIDTNRYGNNSWQNIT